MKNNILIIGFEILVKDTFKVFIISNKKFNIFIIEKKLKKNANLIKNQYKINKKLIFIYLII